MAMRRRKPNQPKVINIETERALIPKEVFDAACVRANTSMQEKNGHTYEHVLKTRCIWCHRSPSQPGKCSGWFQTFLWNLSGELTGVYGAPTGEAE